MHKLWAFTLAAAATALAASSTSSPQFVLSGLGHDTASDPDWSRLSWEGLHVNKLPNVSPPRYLTLSTLPRAELDPSSAVLLFARPVRRSWEDVTQRCGRLAGIEGCRKLDEEGSGSLEQARPSRCKAAKATRDGRALFDPSKPGCEPLAELWRHAQAAPGSVIEETLLSLSARLIMSFQPTARRTGTYERYFWLAHLLRRRAAWPLSNAGWQSSTRANASDETGEWAGGQEPNHIISLMSDPYLPRTEKIQRNDPLNGVGVLYSRWNLGVSLRVPPLPGNTSELAHSRRSTLQPVHAPVGGQVVYVSTFRRDNAPVSGLNDERGWVMSIRDEWGFVWHLFGISPYHQHVYVGQSVQQGKVIGHVSLRPLIDEEPRDRSSPADPPNKPPGGDGNPRYPYWMRELRIGVARPRREWQQWRGPYEDDDDGAWTWYNPLSMLSLGSDQDGVATASTSDSANVSATPPPPPLATLPYIFFARPAPYPPTPPAVIGSVAVTTSPSVDDDDDDDDDVQELSGNVELIVSFSTFAATSQSTVGSSLDQVGTYKLEWAAIPWSEASQGRKGSLQASPDTYSCAGVLVDESSWRVAFGHDKMRPMTGSSARLSRRQSSTAVADADGRDDATTEADEGALWKYIVPAFTTGNFPWTRTKYASQFDWKGRTLFYPLTRTMLTTAGRQRLFDNRPSSSRVLPSYGYWDTRVDSPPGSGRRPDDDGGRGRGQGGDDFWLAVRITDSWGGVTCARASSKVKLRN